MTRIEPGCFVQHIPTGKVRRVSGVRGPIIQFAQVVKGLGKDGAVVTVYWAHESRCLRVHGPSA